MTPRDRKNMFLALGLGAFALLLAVATLVYNVQKTSSLTPQQENADVSL